MFKRFFNGEIALGFAIGVLSLILILGALSYETEHCRNPDQGKQTNPNKNELSAPTINDKKGDAAKAESDQYEPIPCGIVGFPSALIGVFDHHEGFFVGVFTLWLAISTYYLWGSTEKLWKAGELQRLSGEAIAQSQRESSERIGEAQVRAYPFFTGATILYYSDASMLAIYLFIKNSGNSPAVNIVTFAEGIISVKDTIFGISNFGCGQRPSRQPDIGSGETSIPIELSPGILNTNLADATGVKAKITVQGTDVFGSKFSGVITVTVGGAGDWTKPRPMMMLVGETRQLSYESNSPKRA